MRLRRLVFVITASLALFLARTDVRADDAVFGAGASVLPAIATTIADFFQGNDRGLADVIKAIFVQSVWSPDIYNAVNLAENPVSELTVRIAQSKLKLMIQSAANLKQIGGPYVYDEVQGGVGLEYDFIETGPGPGATLVALRFSPLYGEIAFARTVVDSGTIPNLPTEGFLGSSLGVEISKRFGDVQLGARAYAKELIGIGNSQVSGLSFYAAAYAKIRLGDVSGGGNAPPAALYLRPTLNYYDRGANDDDFYALGLTRQLWEALVYFEIN